MQNISASFERSSGLLTKGGSKGKKIGNSKIRNSDILSGLKQGQTKYNMIITEQIYHHSGKGNQSANILTELKKDKYINPIVGCSPKEKLTVDGMLEKIDEYLGS